MKLHARKPVLTAAVLSLSIALGACQAADQSADKAADKSVSADASSTAPASTAIAGLKTEKDQVSYMIGMDVAKSIEPLKGEVDIDVMAKAIKSRLAGEKMLMTDEQAQAVAQAFGQKMQAKQMADRQATAETNQKNGDAFLAKNAKEPGVKTTASGLQYKVIKPGAGPKPASSDTVKVNYEGITLDGKTPFDSSYERGQPAEFKLDSVIPGWTEGVQLMSPGSEYTFWIPGKLAYGEKGTPGGPIGPNATLKFKVELISINGK